MTAYDAWLLECDEELSWAYLTVQPWTPISFSAARLIQSWEAILLINGGAATTDDNDVTLAIAAMLEGTPASEMCFSNDGSDWSAWEPYAATKAWTLAPTTDEDPVVRTVYARFRA